MTPAFFLVWLAVVVGGACGVLLLAVHLDAQQRQRDDREFGAAIKHLPEADQIRLWQERMRRDGDNDLH